MVDLALGGRLLSSNLILMLIPCVRTRALYLCYSMTGSKSLKILGTFMRVFHWLKIIDELISWMNQNSNYPHTPYLVLRQMCI